MQNYTNTICSHANAPSIINKKLIRRWDSKRELFTTTSSTTSKQRAPEATEFGEIMQNKGHYAIQRHRFWYQWKAHTGIWLPISELTSYLAPFSRYSLRSVQNRYICLPFLHLTPRWRGSLYHIIICNISLPLLRLTLSPNKGVPLRWSPYNFPWMSMDSQATKCRRNTAKNLRHGTRNGIMEISLPIIFNRGRHLHSEGGHHVGHRPTSTEFSLC